MENYRERITNLPPEARAKLERRLQGLHATRNHSQIDGEVLELDDRPSSAQERVWFLEQLEPETPLYNIPIGLRLRGCLDTAALEVAINECIARHEALRTNIVNCEGKPRVRVHADVNFELMHEDVSGVTSALREQQALQILERVARQPFDIAAELPLRAVLVRLCEEDHMLLVSVHHSAFDGWSMAVFFSDLSFFYRRALGETGEKKLLSPPSYRNYAAREHAQNIKQDNIDRQLAFWRGKLSDELPVLELPTDRPRGAEHTIAGAHEHIIIPQTVVERLRALAQTENCTLFMATMSVFAMYLCRYAGQEEVIVGIPVAGRNSGEFEDVVGFFVNDLPLRFDISGNPAFREFMQQVRNVTLEAYDNQEVPFERLVAELQPERQLARTPFFQVMLAFQNTDRTLPDLPEINIETVRVSTGTAKFELSMFAFEVDAGLELWVEYSTALYDTATIERFLRNFATTIDNCINAPDTSVYDIAICPVDELTQMMQCWNDTATDYPRHARVEQLIAEQVAIAPKAVALTYDARSITYEELEYAANCVAAKLISLGAHLGDVVAVSADRSPEMIAALLGVLKAGCAYMPIDHAYPDERIEVMLRAAQCRGAIVQDGHVKRYRNFGVEVLPLAEAVCADEQLDTVTQQSEAGAGDVAAVLFTSGSTGRPKGVCISHQAIVRLVRNTNYVDIGRDDVIGHAASVSFDAHLFEVWGALINGAQMVNLDREVILTPDMFASAMTKHSVTIIFLTTSLFNMLISDVPEAFRGLRYLLFGGEQCDPEIVRRALLDARPEHLLHVYGPTESTTFTTWYEVQDVTLDAHTVPIGRAVANTSVYVLDTRQHPVPVGVHGELYIGGDGLATGYICDPEMTAERFIASPVGVFPQQRLYRTGDVVKWSHSGELIFVGRIDEQIKIRGFRVEPGEVEICLRQHPAVENVAAVMHGTTAATKCLVAHVVLRNGYVGDVRELRAYMQARIPEYMVPAHIIVHSEMPLTSTGKVDRTALAALDANVDSPSVSSRLPKDDLERRLALIWGEVLDHHGIGVTDNFFELGGHSLLAVALMARINDELSRELPLSMLFKSPTIAELADEIRDTTKPRRMSTLVPLRIGRGKPPLFCVHEIMGEIMLYRNLLPTITEDRSVYGLQPVGLDGEDEPLSDINEMAARYVHEIVSEFPDGPYHLLGFSSGGSIAYEMALQLREQGRDVGILAVADHPAQNTGFRNRRNVFRARCLWHFAGEICYRLSKAVYDRRPLEERDVDSSLRNIIGIFTGRAQSLPAADPIESLFQNGHLPDHISAVQKRIAVAQWQGLRNYRPGIYSGDLLLFKPRVFALWSSHDPFMGWREVITGDISAVTLACSHMNYIREPNAKRVGEVLDTYMRDWESAHA